MGTSSHVEDPSERAEPPPATATATATATTELGGNAATEEKETDEEAARRLRNQADSLMSKADELERKVIEVTDFYANKKVTNSRKRISPYLKDKMGAGRKEVACSRRMQEVMRQFGTILKQLSKHKWADPFMEPVDVKALDLDDYYEIVKKPMDFTTIKNQMAANVYKNVREIYADARLVFSNAMTYNDIRNKFHVMARTLLEKLEEKWLELLPKVIDAETRQKEEEDVALASMHITQDATIVKLASDTHNELNKLNLLLEELRELVIRRCRKVSPEEKKKIGSGISSLDPDYICKALEIIGQNNPNLHADEVEIDIDEQNEITLWRLKFFVKEALESKAKRESQAKSSAPKARIKGTPETQAKSSAPKARIKGTPETQAKNSLNKAKIETPGVDDTSKRKRMIHEGSQVIYDAYERHKGIYDRLAQTARKRSKNLDS